MTRKVVLRLSPRTLSTSDLSQLPGMGEAYFSGHITDVCLFFCLGFVFSLCNWTGVNALGKYEFWNKGREKVDHASLVCDELGGLLPKSNGCLGQAYMEWPCPSFAFSAEMTTLEQ